MQESNVNPAKPGSTLYFLNPSYIYRQEFFGCLILKKDGNRLVVDDAAGNAVLLACHGLNAADISKSTGLTLTEVKENLAQALDAEIVTTAPNKNKTIVYLENKSFRLGYPRVVYLEITSGCNQRCIHCYPSAGPRLENELTPKELDAVAIELSQNGVEFLCIGGGEPLTSPSLLNLIETSTRNGMAVELATNGTLVTPQLIDQLYNRGLRYVQVSLDAANANTYRSIRGTDSFEQVLGAIEALSKRFVVTVATVLMQANHDQIGGIAAIASSRGAKHYRVLRLMPTGRGANAPAISGETYRQVMKELATIKAEFSGRMNVMLDETFVEPKEKRIEWLPKEYTGCAAARSLCAIDSQGNVYPCSYLRDPRYIGGNIRETSMLKIWTESQAFRSLQELKALTGKCRDCQLAENCGGGCRAAALAATKNILGPDPLCVVNV